MNTLIIGAASGIGRLWAERLVARGDSVVLADRDVGGLAATAPQADVARIVVDVAKATSVTAAFQQAEAALGVVDQVIHTAAIMPTSLAAEDNVERIAKVMEVNYLGSIHVIHAALPAMLARSKGRLVLFSSVAAEALTPHMSAYAASKAALSTYVEILQHELAGSGVEVCLVLPPMTDTPLVDQARNTSNPRSFQLGFERNLAARPETIVARAERAIERGRRWVYPHPMALALHLGRRLAPNLLWKIIEGAEKT
jgi:short-subunit dehydrogenase